MIYKNSDKIPECRGKMKIHLLKAIKVKKEFVEVCEICGLKIVHRNKLGYRNSGQNWGYI